VKSFVKHNVKKEEKKLLSLHGLHGLHRLHGLQSAVCSLHGLRFIPTGQRMLDNAFKIFVCLKYLLSKKKKNSYYKNKICLPK